MTNTTQNNSVSFLPAYLVVGQDLLKRRTVLKRLHKRLEEQGDLTFNFDQFDGSNVEDSCVVNACNTLPFASEIRLVEVHNVEKLDKANTEQIIEYLVQPSPTTVLALVADKLAKNTRLYKAVDKLGKQAVIDCTPLKRRELPQAVRSMATGAGIVITESAAHALIDLVGEDTVHLQNELKKIALAHVGQDAVNDAEVRSLVGRTAEVKPWDFVDSFAARDLQKCVYYYNQMESASVHLLLSLCTSRIRELICARSLIERNMSSALASTLNMPDWKVKNHTRWARGFTQAELEQALIAARDTDQLMKSSGDERTVFFNWFVEVLAPSA